MISATQQSTARNCRRLGATPGSFVKPSIRNVNRSSRDVIVRFINNDNLSISIEALKRAGLDQEILARRSTIFVPSNEAATKFADLYPSTIVGLHDISGRMSINAHIVPEQHIMLADIGDGEMELPTVEGTSIKLTKSGNKITLDNGVNKATVIQPDILMDNLLLHIIDGVLSPIG